MKRNHGRTGPAAPPISPIRWKGWLWRVLLWVISILLLGSATIPIPQLFHYRVDVLVGQRGFDLARWEWEALPPKARDYLAPPDAGLSPGERVRLVREYMDLVGESDRVAHDLERLYAGSGEAGPSQDQVQALQAEQARLEAEREARRPVVEAIISHQVEAALKELGLTTLGRVWPPVAFCLTTSPLHLTISPRAVIRVEAARDLEPGIPLAEQVRLEERIDATLDVSSLIESTGGYGAYPSMILELPDIPWTVGVVAHEWTHNYLAFRPLGWHYFDSPQMRSINETVADIVEEEARLRILERFYPDLVSPPTEGAEGKPSPEEPPAFDFGREMRITRVKVDQLLAEGKVAEAEAYMEARRQVFVEHGYYLRKLNQAYFAFHGTYATGPAASPADPVGLGLTRLRERVASLRAFVDLVDGLRTYDDFLRLMAAWDISLEPPASAGP